MPDQAPQLEAKTSTHAGAPPSLWHPKLNEGPVLVTLEYIVQPEHEMAFVEAIHGFQRVRRRDGATSWGVFYDRETPGHYLEMFLVDSWAEHLRQHSRLTLADRELQARIASHEQGSPKARHFISARAEPPEEQEPSS